MRLRVSSQLDLMKLFAQAFNIAVQYSNTQYVKGLASCIMKVETILKGRRMKHTIRIMASLILCLVVMSACGCSQDAATSSTPSSTSSASQANSSVATTSSSALAVSHEITIEVSNATGSDIVAVCIKAAGSDDYSQENSINGLSFANGETMSLAFHEVSDVRAYDVMLITSDDAKISVKNIDLVSAQDITFCFEEGLGYITYTDPVTGEKKDTLEAAANAEENSQDVPSDLESQVG